MSVHLFYSDNPKKKYMVLVNKKLIHFGDSRYEDFTQHKDPVRKENYVKRHKMNENWNNPFTAGFWAKHLLWNKSTLANSIKDLQKNYNIIIY